MQSEKTLIIDGSELRNEFSSKCLSVTNVTQGKEMIEYSGDIYATISFWLDYLRCKSYLLSLRELKLIFIRSEAT